MSKESKPADLVSHLASSRYEDWCPGCGLYAFVHKGEHRADCTAKCRCWVGHGDCGGCSGVTGVQHEPSCGWEQHPDCPVHPPRVDPDAWEYGPDASDATMAGRIPEFDE